MESSSKHWAQEYVINPLHEPTPAEETGLNASFRMDQSAEKSQPAVKVQNTGSSTSTNPFRRDKPASISTSKNGASSHTRAVSTGSASGSPRTEAFPTHKSGSPRTEAFASYNGGGSPRRSGESPRGPPSASSNRASSTGRPRRSSSLREKYPGDPSVHPLEQLTREAKAANRSPHLRKKHLPGSDSIDKLDDAAFLGAYHHEGPYDAASLARNNSYTSAPLAALSGSNREALKATPRENIQDSIQRHRPLDGVASIPPGETDRFGRTYNYREGAEEDMMRNGQPEGGAYKRYPGINYHPDDLKGKGEPSYTVEKSLKDHKQQLSRGEGDAVELAERPQHSSDTRTDEPFTDDAPAEAASSASASTQNYRAWEEGHRRQTSGSSFDGLKRRIGSLRRKDK